MSFPGLAAHHFNNRPLNHQPQAQFRRPCEARSRPPTSRPRRVPSSSCHVIPAGPTSVPAGSVRHIKSAILLVPTGPVNGPTESSTTVAASVSAELLAAPAYIPPTTSTMESRSNSAICDRPSGSSAGPAPHPPVKNPESVLTTAVSPVPTRWVPAYRPPPAGTLSATPPPGKIRP